MKELGVGKKVFIEVDGEDMEGEITDVFANSYGYVVYEVDLGEGMYMLRYQEEIGEVVEEEKK